VARERCVAFCQDTGSAVFFVEIGSGVRLVGGEIGEALDEGVRRGYDEGFLRKSIVRSPVDRTRFLRVDESAHNHPTSSSLAFLRCPSLSVDLHLTTKATQFLALLCGRPFLFVDIYLGLKRAR
jgi:hypothetical protein